MVNEGRSSELYRLAYQCEENKRKGCPGDCGTCALNVALYTTSINDATLLKATASMDNSKWHQRQAAIDTKNMINGIIALGVIIFICSMFYQCTHPSKPAYVQQTQQAQPVIAMPVTTPNPGDFSVKMPAGMTRPAVKPPSPAAITSLVHKNIRDVTRDGLVNCQDYAMIFFCIVGDPNICRVIINENPHTGMNHLFVRYKGITIEPKYGAPMVDIWGDTYDPAYDIDQTDYWYYTRTSLN